MRELGDGAAQRRRGHLSRRRACPDGRGGHLLVLTDDGYGGLRHNDKALIFFRRVGDRIADVEHGRERVVFDQGMFVLIIKPPSSRPGRRGSLELGRRASKLVSKLFGVVGRDDPGESDEGVLKRSIGKWLRSESKEDEM